MPYISISYVNVDDNSPLMSTCFDSAIIETASFKQVTNPKRNHSRGQMTIYLKDTYYVFDKKVSKVVIDNATHQHYRDVLNALSLNKNTSDPHFINGVVDIEVGVNSPISHNA